MADSKYFYALGRRKSSTARVRLSSGKGKFTINDKDLNAYLSDSKHLHSKVSRPMVLLELDPTKFDISVKVSGGGLSGQVDAVSLAISKSLVTLNEDYKSTLKRAGLLGRDPREKERKKFGLKGARKQRQFTKR